MLRRTEPELQSRGSDIRSGLMEHFSGTLKPELHVIDGWGDPHLATKLFAEVGHASERRRRSKLAQLNTPVKVLPHVGDCLLDGERIRQDRARRRHITTSGRKRNPLNHKRDEGVQQGRNHLSAQWTQFRYLTYGGLKQWFSFLASGKDVNISTLNFVRKPYAIRIKLVQA